MKHNLNSAESRSKRRTLKILLSTSSVVFLTGRSAIASILQSESTPDNLIDCKLISRADISRAHLLIHNRNDADLIVAGFKSQIIRYDNSSLNLNSAFVKTVTIPARDRVMIRLNMESAFQPASRPSDIIDKSTDTQYLPQGTRVVDMKLQINNGIAEIDVKTTFS